MSQESFVDVFIIVYTMFDRFRKSVKVTNICYISEDLDFNLLFNEINIKKLYK